MNELRKGFEKTSARYSLCGDIYFDDVGNQYKTKNKSFDSMVTWLNGAWFMYQELNK